MSKRLKIDSDDADIVQPSVVLRQLLDSRVSGHVLEPPPLSSNVHVISVYDSVAVNFRNELILHVSGPQPLVGWGPALGMEQQNVPIQVIATPNYINAEMMDQWAVLCATVLAHGVDPNDWIYFVAHLRDKQDDEAIKILCMPWAPAPPQSPDILPAPGGLGDNADQIDSRDSDDWDDIPWQEAGPIHFQATTMPAEADDDDQMAIDFVQHGAMDDEGHLSLMDLPKEMRSEISGKLPAQDSVLLRLLNTQHAHRIPLPNISWSFMDLASQSSKQLAYALCKTDSLLLKTDSSFPRTLNYSAERNSVLDAAWFAGQAVLDEKYVPTECEAKNSGGLATDDKQPPASYQHLVENAEFSISIRDGMALEQFQKLNLVLQQNQTVTSLTLTGGHLHWGQGFLQMHTIHVSGNVMDPIAPWIQSSKFLKKLRIVADAIDHDGFSSQSSPILLAVGQNTSISDFDLVRSGRLNHWCEMLLNRSMRKEKNGTKSASGIRCIHVRVPRMTYRDEYDPAPHFTEVTLPQLFTENSASLQTIDLEWTLCSSLIQNLPILSRLNISMYARPFRPPAWFNSFLEATWWKQIVSLGCDLEDLKIELCASFLEHLSKDATKLRHLTIHSFPINSLAAPNIWLMSLIPINLPWLSISSTTGYGRSDQEYDYATSSFDFIKGPGPVQSFMNKISHRALEEKLPTIETFQMLDESYTTGQAGQIAAAHQEEFLKAGVRLIVSGGRLDEVPSAHEMTLNMLQNTKSRWH